MLEILVAFLQAFIFTLLSIIFVARWCIPSIELQTQSGGKVSGIH